jgi:hypothetical protein
MAYLFGIFYKIFFKKKRTFLLDIEFKLNQGGVKWWKVGKV